MNSLSNQEGGNVSTNQAEAKAPKVYKRSFPSFFSQLSENLHLKRALTPKIRDQEVLTRPLAYCTWITEFAKQDVNESKF